MNSYYGFQIIVRVFIHKKCSGEVNTIPFAPYLFTPTTDETLHLFEGLRTS